MSDHKSYLLVGGHNNMKYRIIEEYRSSFDIYVKDNEYTIVNEVLSYYPTEFKTERYVKDHIIYKGFIYYFFRLNDMSMDECLKTLFGNSERYESQYK